MNYVLWLPRRGAPGFIPPFPTDVAPDRQVKSEARTSFRAPGPGWTFAPSRCSSPWRTERVPSEKCRLPWVGF